MRDKSGIHAAALDVLETVGFGEAPDFTRERLTAAGCRVNDADRLCFPRSLVEDTIARANRSLTLHGQKPEHDIDASGSKTWFSTGCGSVRLVDPESRTTRPTTAADVYDFARLVDALDHIHMFHRLGIPTDIEDTDDVDINLCYACVRGTSKPVSTSWFNGRERAPLDRDARDRRGRRGASGAGGRSSSTPAASWWRRSGSRRKRAWAWSTRYGAGCRCS